MTEIARRSAAAIESDRTRARTQMLFEASPTPMWVYDFETLRFLAVNDATVERYGYTRDEFLGGMTIKDIRPPEEVPLLLADISSHGGAGSREAKELAPSAPRRVGDRRRGHHRADRLRGPPRRARRGARRERAQAARAPAHGRGEDGGDRAARRRRRARLQQPPDRHLRLHRDPARPRRRRGAGGDRPRRAPGGGPHAPAAGLQPAPGAAPEGAGPERDRRRDGVDAASHHRRRRERGDAARGGPLGRRGRSRADRARDPQPRRQRPRRDAARRRAHARDAQRRARGARHGRAHRSARAARRLRHRRRHGREGPRAPVRAVLHHQAGRRGHGPGARDRVRRRQAERRRHLRLQRARQRHHVQDLPARAGLSRRRERRR